MSAAVAREVGTTIVSILLSDTADHLVSHALGLAGYTDRKVKRTKMNKQHCLCVLFADLAEAVDAELVASAVAALVSQELLNKGTPPIVAKFAEGVTQRAITAGIGLESTATAFRALGLAFCPNPDRCPAGVRIQKPLLASAIVDTLPPRLADALRSSPLPVADASI